MPKPRDDDDTVITYANGIRVPVGTVHILESGWLRIHWLDDSLTYDSPHNIIRAQGPGVIYSDQ